MGGDRLHCALDRRPVRVRRVDECETLDELFTSCLPAFGGAFLRRIYTILDEAIGRGCPLTLAVSGAGTLFGDDGALRDQGIIRVADMGFPEDVLLDQDRFITAFLQKPELQKKMTGTE